MALGNVNMELWTRFRSATRAKGLGTTKTLEKLISTWLEIYADEEFRIPRQKFIDVYGEPEGKGSSARGRRS